MGIMAVQMLVPFQSMEIILRLVEVTHWL